jgi:NDP-sugar pyrophosphorylase family protein
VKACLICPSGRPDVSALAHFTPLANVPILGKSLLEYWIEHLAGRGAKHIQVLASDRPEMTQELVGDGARWGLRADVTEETRELSPDLARTKYPILQKADWLPEPEDMVALNHLPGMPQYQLFDSYDGWFSALKALLPRTSVENCLGMRELRTGVFVSTRANISSSAELRGPCWIGADVTVGSRSVIGPMAILEDRVVIESNCEITNSVVAPETMVGKFTELNESLAWGSTLVNWKTGSVTEISDPFLLCALREPRRPQPKAKASVRPQYNPIYDTDKDELELLWNHHGINLP